MKMLSLTSIYYIYGRQQSALSLTESKRAATQPNTTSTSIRGSPLKIFPGYILNSDQKKRGYKIHPALSFRDTIREILLPPITVSSSTRLFECSAFDSSEVSKFPFYCDLFRLILFRLSLVCFTKDIVSLQSKHCLKQ